MSWVHHPARERPGLTVLATLIIVAFSASVLMADGELLLACVAAGVLLLSIAQFLLPTRYTLTQREVIAERLGRLQRRRWGDLRRWDEGPAGFFLSPFPTRRGWVEERRGVALRGGDREAIRRRLVEHLGHAQAAQEAKV